METNHPSSDQKTVKTVMIIKVKLFSLSIVNKYIMIIIVDSFDFLSKTILLCHNILALWNKSCYLIYSLKNKTLQ